MSKLFDQILEISRWPHGWCSAEKARTLCSIILATRPEFVVEVGVWSGKSFVPMALACQMVGRGVVIGIDPWHPMESAKGQDGENRKWWNTVDHDLIKRFFDTKLEDFRLEKPLVDIRRCKSDDYTPPMGIGLLHLDGNHGEQAVRDVNRYASNVRVGGFAVLDDLHWEGGKVSLAVQRIKEFGFVELFRVEGPEQETGMMNDWACFQRTEDITP